VLWETAAAEHGSLRAVERAIDARMAALRINATHPLQPAGKEESSLKT
jgi:hypothetical protein